MKDQKAVFFDIDGTLFDKDIGIPESAREGIHKLKENGHIPIICTGRTKSFISDEVLKLGCEGIIAGAGTYVEYQGNLLQNAVLEAEVLREVDELLTEYSIKYVMEGPERMYYNGRETDEEYRIKVETWNEVSTLEPFDYRNCEINKFSCFFESEEEKARAVQLLQKYFDIILHENMPFTEVMPRGVSKATGIARMLETLDVAREHTYAFGDSANDLDMLAYVQYGIAMGNACPSVLKSARYKTKTLPEDGIYYGLKQFGLI